MHANQQPTNELSLGGVTLPSKSIFIAGAPDAGAYAALDSICQQALAANQKMFVCNLPPNLTGKLLREGDVHLHLSAERGACWSFKADLPLDEDRYEFAKTLFPSRYGYCSWITQEEHFITLACWDVLAVLMGKCDTLHGVNGVVTIANQSPAEVIAFLSGTRAANSIRANDIEHATAVLKMIRRHIQPFNFVRDPQAGEDGFSFCEWAASNKDSRWVSASWGEDAAKPLVGAWISILARNILSLTPSAKPPTDAPRQVWIAINEISSLPHVKHLTRLMVGGNKYVCSVVVTAQDISKVEEVYAQTEVEAMFTICKTRSIFRCRDTKAAEALARLANWSSQVTGRATILPSEIQSLGDMRCFLVPFEATPIALVQIPHAV